MDTWDDPVVAWSEAIAELVKWRRERRLVAQQATELIAETEVFLALVGGQRPPGADPA
jgi:hypothetical protein